MNTQILNIRIDKQTKAEAQKVVEKMGLDLSSAVKLFINKMVMTESIPFEVNTKGRLNDIKYIKQVVKETKQAVAKGKRYSSARAALNSIK